MALVSNALVTIEMLRSYIDREMTGNNTGTLSDDNLALWINMCTAGAERTCQRWLGVRTATVETHPSGHVVGLSTCMCDAPGAYPIRSITSLVLAHKDGSSETVPALSQGGSSGWHAYASDLHAGLIYVDGVSPSASDMWQVTGTFGLLPVTNGALDADATVDEHNAYDELSSAILAWAAQKAAFPVADDARVSLDAMTMVNENNDIPKRVWQVLVHYRRISL